MSANAIFGSKPKILFNAQWHAFSCVISMKAKKKKNQPLKLPEGLIFLFLIRDFSLSYDYCAFLSDDKERVAIWTELVVHFECHLICLHHVFISTECSYRHKHCRAWAMEV